MRDGLSKAYELPSSRWFCNIKFFWLEDIRFKHLVEDITPKP